MNTNGHEQVHTIPIVHLNPFVGVVVSLFTVMSESEDMHAHAQDWVLQTYHDGGCLVLCSCLKALHRELTESGEGVQMTFESDFPAVQKKREQPGIHQSKISLNQTKQDEKTRGKLGKYKAKAR